MLATLVVLAVAGPAVPAHLAGAAPPTTLLDSLPAAARPRIVEARSTAAAVRAVESASGIAGVIAAVAAAGGAPPPRPTLPPAHGADLERLVALDPGLRSPVAGLLAAVRLTSSQVGRFPLADVTAAAASLHRALAERAATFPLSPGMGDTAPSIDLLARGRLVGRIVERGLDASPSRQASPDLVASSMLIAAALDAYLPPLLEAAPSVRPGVAERTADGCDLVRQLPVLCVGSDADNVHTEEADLLIDLGGNDTYEIPAGGAPFLPEGSMVFHSVSVNVDLGGDDRYEGAPAAWPDESFPVPTAFGAGAGAIGAIGIAVDADGDDVYDTVAPAPAGSPPASYAAAQGAGFGGVGALFDLGGSDGYSIRSPDGHGDDVTVFGQGAGTSCQWRPGSIPVTASAGCGLGLLADLGADDDQYSLDGGTLTGPAQEWDSSTPFIRPARQLIGQGAGIIGLGALLDDGGADELRLEAEAVPVMDNGFHNVNFYSIVIMPNLTAAGQGYGEVGVGLLLTGDGATRYTSQQSLHGPTRSLNLVQGVGFFAGTGILDDGGGDDVYSARASTEDLDRDVLIDDTCRTPDPETGGPAPCPGAYARVWAISPIVAAQGWGGLDGGRGSLNDLGGDDVYEAANRYELEASLRDELSEPEMPPRLEIQLPAPPVSGQGWGISQGDGLLLDAAGIDRYSIDSFGSADAAATTEHAEGEPSTETLALPRALYLGGQGAADQSFHAAGALLDLGGTGDRFTARARTDVRAAPNPEGAVRMGLRWPPFQGSGYGGLLVALGDQPAIVSSPSQGVCALSTGARGFGDWAECDVYGPDPDHQIFDVATEPFFGSPFPTELAAFGTAPNAAGESVTFRFLSETPSTAVDGEGVIVSASLFDAAGQPMTGEVVRFDLQFGVRARIDAPVQRAWMNGWEVEAVTDERGIAAARLPTAVNPLRVVYASPPDWEFRLVATYDGSLSPPRLPAHVAAPITIEPAD